MPELRSDLYDRTAHVWDAARSKSLFERKWLDRFMSLLPQAGTILDIGCGSGEPIARYFIDSGFAITGIDASPALIAMCKHRFPEQDWHVADMRALHMNARFDGLIAWHSFFHLSRDDQRKMFALFAAHINPKGILMFTSGPQDGESIGEWQGEPLYHASLSPDEYRELLAANGLTVVDHRAEDQECGGATVWLARQMSPASGLDGSA
ncbi:class I SAM-dependent DNA methyltransferase [Allosphingosinicella vermicomposti]|uniref:class I SAM-dependent DNA methyltransferase n=1 Tax=Allosphingosinicella vermicomposti TaxID=614671 RepID=UPI000D0FBC75|nr:class I SAM-dependent methyltransferase [Allosphingosinicella vermicomposti]